MPVQSTTITPQANPGTVFTFGGNVRVDGLATRTTDGDIGKGTAGRDFYVPGAIPVGGDGPDTYSDAHVKFSRVWFDASTVLDSGDRLGARVEFDFFGGALGNSAATNTYGATLRHAYLTWNRWLVGQTWSNFMDTSALLDSVDFVGPTDGLVFVRQPQARYANGPWAISLESPETTVQPFGGGPHASSQATTTRSPTSSCATPAGRTGATSASPAWRGSSSMRPSRALPAPTPDWARPSAAC